MRRPALTTALLSAALVLVTGCSNSTPQVRAPDNSTLTTASAAPNGDTATATEVESAPAPDSATTTLSPPEAGPSEGGVYLNPGASYARSRSDQDLSILEQAMLREPGPYAGDDFRAEAAFEAILADNPQSSREWAEAILTQIHPDYVEAAQRVIAAQATAVSSGEKPRQELRDVPVVGQNHFAIVLDAGASMAEPAEGATRLSRAKDAIRDMVERLPQSSTVSLRVYGQAGSNTEADREESCASTSLVYSGPPDGVDAALDDVQPGGWAPLALAVGRSGDDIPPNTSDAIVYVVTDGTETCDGDPMEAAEELSTRRLQPVVNVIGFQADAADTEQLRLMAQAGKGAYTAVETGAELEDYWDADRQAMLDAWRVWQDEALMRIEGRDSATLGRAQDPGQAVMTASDEEWEQATQLVRLMRRDGLVDFQTRLATWDELYDRHIAIWGWGYEDTLGHLAQTYEQRVSSWAYGYDLGVNRWSTYYGKGAQSE